MSKLGRNDPCACGSGRKYEAQMQLISYMGFYIFG
jgi:uncharacterized protein YecA (UPF0149 family)